MSKAEKRSLAVGGIQLNVFSPLGSDKATGRVAVLFLLHGRLSKADDLGVAATKMVDKSEDRRRSTPDGDARRLVVVTFVSRTVRPGKRAIDPAIPPGPEESRSENDQPSRKPTMERRREGE